MTKAIVILIVLVVLALIYHFSRTPMGKGVSKLFEGTNLGTLVGISLGVCVVGFVLIALSKALLTYFPHFTLTISRLFVSPSLF